MKSKFVLSLGFSLIFFLSGNGQDRAGQSLFRVYEERVLPGKVQAYERTMRSLIEAMESHGVALPTWSVVSTTEYVYYILLPMRKMADLDEPLFTELADQMSEDDFSGIWKRFNTCYSSLHTYTLRLEKGLSYRPATDRFAPAERLHRANTRFFVKPEHLADARATLAAIRELCQDHQLPWPYRVYSSGFGAAGPYFLLVNEAESAADHGLKIQAFLRKPGSDFEILYQQLLTYCWKIEEQEGSVRPDLSHGLGWMEQWTGQP